MGTLEKNLHNRMRRGLIQKIILSTVTTAGLLSVAVLAPNALQMLRLFGFGKSKRQKEIIANSRKKLTSAGLLEYAENGFLRLTPKGEAKLRWLELNDYKLKKPKRWDKKWRVIIFDVHEGRKYIRDKIRRTLVGIGFVRLQYSVWVYPYDCEDLITLLKADFKIGKEVLYLIVDTIENDAVLKKQFGLK